MVSMVINCTVRKLDHNKINYERRKIGGKWKPMILFILYVKPARFNKIKQLLPDISSTQMAKSIRELERNKIIERSGACYTLSQAGYRITSLLIEIKSIIESIPD